MKPSWRDDVLCWRLTVPRRGAQHVRGLLNYEHVQDHCSCLSAQRRYKPTVFSLSICRFLFFFLCLCLSLSSPWWSLQLMLFITVKFSCLISHVWSSFAVRRSVEVDHCKSTGPAVRMLQEEVRAKTLSQLWVIRQNTQYYCLFVWDLGLILTKCCISALKMGYVNPIQLYL